MHTEYFIMELQILLFFQFFLILRYSFRVCQFYASVRNGRINSKNVHELLHIGFFKCRIFNFNNTNFEYLKYGKTNPFLFFSEQYYTITVPLGVNNRIISNLTGEIIRLFTSKGTIIVSSYLAFFTEASRSFWFFYIPRLFSL